MSRHKFYVFFRAFIESCRGASASVSVRLQVCLREYDCMNEIVTIVGLAGLIFFMGCICPFVSTLTLYHSCLHDRYVHPYALIEATTHEMLFL